MIAYISGIIHAVRTDALIVLTGGIGYEVFVPQQIVDGAQVGATVELSIHHHVREDIFALYGFENAGDLVFFKQLIQVSGVGPRLALSVMSQLSTSQIQQAIVQGDVRLLTGISGVGKKTAERIILDLKDAMDVLPVDQAAGGTAAVSVTAVDALISLGYSNQEARDALLQVDTALAIEEQIREALKRL